MLDWLYSLYHAVSVQPFRMSQSTGIENHDWLGSLAVVGGGEGLFKENTSSPALQQNGHRRRADTMSSVRSYIGLQPEAPIDKEHDDLEHHELFWSRIRLALREPFAEFFGTFIMVLFGDGKLSSRPVISLSIMLKRRRPFPCLLKHVFWLWDHPRTEILILKSFRLCGSSPVKR